MKKPITFYIVSGICLIAIMTLHKWYKDKQNKNDLHSDYLLIQNFLLDDNTILTKNTKPILWIHIPYEYNSRNWSSFGSRSNTELNQPYLYLTTKSIITKCNDSFKICLIDDNSFKKLIPSWNIDTSKVSGPILSNIRQMGLMKLIYIYGGMICPISFICLKDLIGIYNKGTADNKMFVCENHAYDISSSTYKFYPDICFMGSSKNNETTNNLIHYIQRIISTDNTSNSIFSGDINLWCKKEIENNNMNIIRGGNIGIKNTNEKPIHIENLFSQTFFEIDKNAYGLLLPAKDILKRRKYEWFSRLSAKQVIESNTMIGKYLLLSNGDEVRIKLDKPNWVGFWKTPLTNVYGTKPNYLGDNLLMSKTPNY
jgi:hypothetical protein